MTIDEREERFFNFEGCIGTACSECSYYDPENRIGPKNCQDKIHEDAKLIMKHSAGEEAIKTIVEDNRPPVFKAPLTAEDRERILETIRLKTEVPDLSAHFIQEINELCCGLNSLAVLVSKLEQLRKGTDPIGKIVSYEEEKTELLTCINIEVEDSIEEAADVYNYLWVFGYSDKLEHFREDVDEKLARWANRLNGVSDE